MKTIILAIGKLRGPEAAWCDEYKKRLTGELVIKEMAASGSRPAAEIQKAEGELLLKALPPQGFVVLLDERGKDLSSRELAGKIKAWHEQVRDPLVFRNAPFQIRRRTQRQAAPIREGDLRR